MPALISRRWIKVLTVALTGCFLLWTMSVVPPLGYGRSILVGSEQYSIFHEEKAKGVPPIKDRPEDPNFHDSGNYNQPDKAVTVAINHAKLADVQGGPVHATLEVKPSRLDSGVVHATMQVKPLEEVFPENPILRDELIELVDVEPDWKNLLWDETQPSPEIPKPFSTDKCAFIIESHPTNSLNAILLHFKGVLGPAWPIFIFTADPSALPLTPSMKINSDGSQYDPTDSSAIHPFNIRALPPGLTITSHALYSRFLVEPWLWSQLAPFEKVMVFQSDSILCANSQRRADDFLEWDFIGAPIAPSLGYGYNGGLSIRNRTLMLDIIKEYKDSNIRKKNKFEDRFYYKMLKRIPGVKLPHPLLANKFSTESIYQEEPLGYHQPAMWHRSKLVEKKKWCPELNLAEGPRLIDALTAVPGSGEEI
ncbi:hypothetical protein MKZ38_010462 [Zalerion maritima]|uniref:DUF5672 domain-containing protein n=1 Tax=Zalerion maritima TaxID=339359 RepID=A0AAD5RFF8_9PEZI|nr:hypothetical protein MKZ38_010462 [Zalerion maritima]